MGILSGYYFTPLYSHINKVPIERIKKIYDDIIIASNKLQITASQYIAEKLLKLYVNSYWLAGWTMYRLPNFK